jgi:hypothetical protein
MKKHGFILIIFFILINVVFPQGESAVPFLLIAPGARAGGMGEAGVAMANDATAIFWNPAGLAFQYEDPEIDSKGEISLMHVKWLPQFNFDDLWYEYLASRYYIEDIGMLGLSITYLNLGENVYTGTTGPEVLGTFDSFEYAITGSYATKIKENLGIGFNLKFIYSMLKPDWVLVGMETLNGVGKGFGVDVAVLWIPAYEFLHNKLRVGANLANFGPKITYANASQADPLPTNLKLGFAYKLLDDEFNRITLVYDLSRLLVYRNKKDGSSDGVVESVFYSSWVKGRFSDRLRKFIHSVGMEYWYGNLIALRAGYFYEDKDFGGRKFLTFGGGIKYSIFGIDFGYISAEEDHPLSDTMRFSILVQF